MSDMLFAYELNMLGEGERREVEMHLMDCDHCYERARHFQTIGKLMRDDPEAQECVRSVVEDNQSTAESDSTMGISHVRRRTPVFLRFAVLASVIVLVLILKPWRIEFKPSHEAVASENRLAVMYFENLADSSGVGVLGEIVTNLFITDLSQSEHLQVVSNQRLYDILKQLGHEGAKSLDRNTANEVARQARAKWIITGSILQVQPRYIITAQLVEVSTGLTLASRKLIGEPHENVFAFVDRLTVEVKQMLALPSAAYREKDRLVVEVTTNSREAYYNYLKGLDNYNKLYYREAVVYFRQALELDSTFAMAYYYLAQLVDDDLIAKAVEYSDGTSPIEKHYISSLNAAISRDYEKAVEELQVAVKRYPEDKEAFYRMGRYRAAQGRHEEAIQMLDNAIRIDPGYGVAFNQLAYAYDAIGDFERAIQAVDNYILTAPGEANPYDSRGEICARNGRLDEAIDAYRRAAAIKPDFVSSWMNLGFMYIYKGEYSLADSCLRVLVSIGNQVQRSAARLYLSYIPLYQGKFEEALDVLDDGLSADRIGRAPGQAYQYAQILAEKGETEKAELVAGELQAYLADHDRPMASYHYARGFLELAVGNPSAAERHFEKAVTPSPDFFGRFVLARTRLQLGRLSESIAAFEELSREYSSLSLYLSNLSVSVYYYLGLAYEQEGDADRAKARYETFLKIWEDSDPGISSVKNAKERLARLRSKS
jgi:tetratricopeptide (TPR) repeat protein